MKADEPISLKIIFTELWPFLWSSQESLRLRFIICLLVLIFSMGINVFTPILLKHVVNSLEFGVSWQVSGLLIAYGIIWTLAQISIPIRETLMIKPVQRSIRLFCTHFLKHLHELPFTFHIYRSTGKITNSLERAQHALPSLIWGIAFLIVPTFIEISCAAFVIYYYYGWFYITVIFLTLFIFTIFSMFTMRYSLATERESNSKELEASAKLVDSILNYTTVKYFNNQAYEVRKCDDALAEREIAVTKTLFVLESIKIAQSLILGSGLLLILFCAGQQIVAGKLRIGDFVLLNGYILQFSNPLTFVGYILKEAQQSYIDISNIIKILKYPFKKKEFQILAPKICNAFESIVFEDVSFGYSQADSVLNHISFKMTRGESTALVGPTGVGKSTLLHLLLGLYKPDTGRILINGQDISTLNQELLMEIMGIVPQDVHLFHGTIKENILYARFDASTTALEDALELACFNFHNFEVGLETLLGERGARLSQGEKQRLALARLFLKKPPLCILDEHTSSLDPQTEREVQKNIKAYLQGHTFLIVAHRLRTIIHSNQILVFDKGKIVEQGTHQQLLQVNGLYSRLWTDQHAIPETESPVRFACYK